MTWFITRVVNGPDSFLVSDHPKLDVIETYVWIAAIGFFGGVVLRMLFY